MIHKFWKKKPQKKPPEQIGLVTSPIVCLQTRTVAQTGSDHKLTITVTQPVTQVGGVVLTACCNRPISRYYSHLVAAGVAVVSVTCMRVRWVSHTWKYTQ